MYLFLLWFVVYSQWFILLCPHSWGFYLCPYCLAVNAHWIGSYIFINNVFLLWCASAAKEFSYQIQVQILLPKSNITMMNKCVHIGLLYNYTNGQVCTFLFLGFVFMSYLSSRKCTMERFIYIY